MRFELNRLASRSNEDLYERFNVSPKLIPDGPLTLPQFHKHSKVHSTTLRNRFGGWRQALVAAGIGNRYNTTFAPLTREKIIANMRQAAAALGKRTLTKKELYRSSTSCARAIAREFCFLGEALKAAGLGKDILSARVHR